MPASLWITLYDTPHDAFSIEAIEACALIANPNHDTPKGAESKVGARVDRVGEVLYSGGSCILTNAKEF
jgi:hypothetical protein